MTSRINLTLTDKEAKNIQQLKDEYGILATTDLIRFIIRKSVKDLDNKK